MFLTEDEQDRYEEYTRRRKEIMNVYNKYLMSWKQTKIHIAALKVEFKDILDKIPYKGKQ
jgi:hypothetical protein